MFERPVSDLDDLVRPALTELTTADDAERVSPVLPEETDVGAIPLERDCPLRSPSP
jgi:hypothetical protein